MGQDHQKHHVSHGAFVGMLTVVVIAWALRLIYALSISPFNDEYITMLAAREVLRTGLPILPSGLFYDHGILHVYWEALFLGLAGFTIDVARIASVFIGILVIVVLYVVGWRWFSARTGLLAAWLLTWSAADVIWQGRARMYVAIQLMFLAGAFLLYEGLVQRDSRLYRCLGIAALAGSVLAHLVAIPYIMTMSVVLITGYLWTRRQGAGKPLRVTRLWPELLVGMAGAGLVVWARWAAGPSWSTAGRVVTDATELIKWEVIGRVLAWMRLFLVWPNLVWFTLVVVGIVMVTMRLMHRTVRSDDLMWLYLLVTWLGSVVGLGIFSIWYADSYIIGLTPLFYLTAARELDELGSVIAAAVRRQDARSVAAWVLTSVIAASVALLSGPSVVDALTYDSVQLKPALDYVRTHLRDEDVLATFAPYASLLTVGRVDFYGQERGFPFIETEAGRVDIWTGTPALDSVEDLAALLDTQHRVWLIAPRENWQRHYSEDYRDLVEARMTLVFDGTGTLVYLSQP